MGILELRELKLAAHEFKPAQATQKYQDNMGT